MTRMPPHPLALVFSEFMRHLDENVIGDDGCCRPYRAEQEKPERAPEVVAEPGQPARRRGRQGQRAM
jgi:hypothetical protein